MWFTIDLILLILTQAVANLTVPSYASYIAAKSYKSQFITSVVWTGTHSDDVNDFLIKFPGTAVILHLIFTEADLQTKQNSDFKQTVAFATNLNEFQYIMTVINEKRKYPIRLILAIPKPISELTELSSFFEIAWRTNLVDVVIISRKISGQIIISSYFPYKDGICGNYMPVLLEEDENMFPKKFDNFNNCPIRASVVPLWFHVNAFYENGKIVDVEGYDGKTLKVVQKKVNCSLELIQATGNKIGTYADGKATGAFYDLLHNRSDILIPAGLLSQGRYSVTQFTHVYHDLDMRWIGPKRREIYHWIKVIKPFLNSITPVLCCAFILFVTVVIVVSRRHKINNKNSVCFQAFAVLVGQTIDDTTTVPLLNYLFLLWTSFCFIIRIIYQGDLVVALQNPILEQPFGTIEESVDRVDGHGGAEVILDYYRNTSVIHGFKKLSVSDFHSYTRSIAEGKRFLLATDFLLARQYRNSLQVLSIQISSPWSCFYMRPGWPVAPTVDAIILRLSEAGFIKKLQKMSDKVFKKESNDYGDNEEKPLDMTMLSTCFYAMFIMWVACGVILIIEIIYFKYTNKVSFVVM